MNLNTKHLSILSYKEPDRPLLDIWYTSGLTYEQLGYDRTTYPYKMKYSGKKYNHIYIQLILFRVVFLIEFKYNITNIDPAQARLEHLELIRSVK